MGLLKVSLISGCPLYQTSVVCAAFFTPIAHDTIEALLHCKLSILPSYTIRTKTLLCNLQNFYYLDIFHTKKMVEVNMNHFGAQAHIDMYFLAQSDLTTAHFRIAANNEANWPCSK